MKETIKKFFRSLLMDQDKANHAFYGLLTYAVISIFNVDIALFVVFIISIGKEIFDEIDYGGFDMKDFLYTFMPSLVLYLMQY